MDFYIFVLIEIGSILIVKHDFTVYFPSSIFSYPSISNNCSHKLFSVIKLGKKWMTHLAA